MAKRNLKSKMLLQVHDELIFNVLKEEKEIMRSLVTDIMESLFTADKIGRNKLID